MLPSTKVTPKELLNVYDRPALQFAIDEAIALLVLPSGTADRRQSDRFPEKC